MKLGMRMHKQARAAAQVSFEALPPDIASKLRQAVRRIRSIIWMRGLLAVVAAAAIAILAIMAVDAMVMIYASGIRWAMWSCGVAAVAATAFHMLARPLSKPFTPARIAAMIERNHPELEERLSTVVELISQPGTAAEGSSQLLDVLTGDAVRDVMHVSPAREFTTRTVKPKLVVAAAALGLIALLFAIWPKSMSRLVLRAVLPSAQVDNLYADNLSVSPGDAYVLEGEPLAFELAIEGGYPQQAFLRTQAAGADGEVVERMRQTSSEKGEGEEIRYYRHFMPEVAGSFRYRVACGSALTRFYDITAVPVPAYTNLVITCDYPAYTGVGVRTNEAGAMAVEAVAGSRIGVAIKTQRPLSSALILADGEREGVPAADGAVAWTFDLGEETAGLWSVRLHDAHGFTNAPAFHPVRIVKDMPPTIELVAPEKLAFTLPPYGELPIAYVVKDDFGIAAAELRVGAGYAPLERARDVALSPAGSGVWRGDDAIALSTLAVGGAGKVRVQLAVRDNLPEALGGPQEAFSAVIEITLDRTAESLAAQLLAEQYEKIAKTADAVTTALEEALREAQAGLAEIDRQADEPAVRRLGASLAAIVKAEGLIREMVGAAGEGMFESLVPEMRRLLQGTVEPAHAQADVAMLSNPAERRPEVVKLIAVLEGAVAAAQELEEDVAERKAAAEEASEMADMADRQEALAEQAEQETMTPEQMEAWRKEQEALKDEFEQKTEDPAAPKPLEAAKKQAEELAGAIDQLKQEQERLRETVAKLDDPAAAEKARAELEQGTPEMPQDASPEARAEAMQEGIAKRAEALQDQVSEMAEPFNALGEAFEELTKPISTPLDQASSSMDQAQKEAEEAAGQMEKPAPQEGNPEPKPDLDAAGEKMEDAAENMETASQALDKAGEAMDALSDKLEQMAQEAAKAAQEAMESAMDAAQEAQKAPPQEGEAPPGETPPQPQPGAPQPPQPGAMQPAAEQAKKAAEQMKSLAEQLAQQAGLPVPGPPMPGQPEPGEPVPGAPPKGKPSDSPQPGGEQGEGGMLGVPADWFKTHGDMSPEALSDALESVPAEYRELVKAYFTELSKEAK